MVDAKDKKIIGLLRENSRISVRDIAKKTGIRPSTVHQRIQKLRKKGVIEKFTVKLDDRAVDQSFIVFMLLKGESHEYINQKILSKPNVKEVFGVTGEYDMLLKMKFRDIEEFNSFIINFRKENKDIRSTITMVATAKLKEDI
ncbi:winged helix-turn-helix transcriptional regulator [Candidatus Woesearchaeota archaeon]|nr:winged helix-turn-helix transcriptional regulator [Candidatus Woesearchaeota archaeon]